MSWSRNQIVVAALFVALIWIFMGWKSPVPAVTGWISAPSQSSFWPFGSRSHMTGGPASRDPRLTQHLTDRERRILRDQQGMPHNNPRSDYYYRKYGRAPPPGDQQLAREGLEESPATASAQVSTGPTNSSTDSGSSAVGADQSGAASTEDDDDYLGDPSKVSQTWEEQMLMTQITPDAVANQRKFTEAHYRYSRQPGWPSYVIESEYTPFTGFARWRPVRERDGARQTSSLGYEQYNRPLDFSMAFGSLARAPPPE